MEFISKSVEETKKIAFDFTKAILGNPGFERKTATIVGLYGELGAGKTTFMKCLAESLGVKETIQSPTFVIMKIFDLPTSQSFNKLIHIDAYRLEKEEEMLHLGWQEIISDSKNLICVEWPKQIAGIMPTHIMIRFEHGERENERKISIT